MELYMNMNIDDVIKALKNGEYLTNREQEQIAEWLEELKTLRLDSCMIHMPERLHLVENGYNKALDDFVKELKNHYTEYNIDCVLEDANFYSYTTACNYLEDYIDEIAEHLKAGVKNGTDNQ